MSKREKKTHKLNPHAKVYGVAITVCGRPAGRVLAVRVGVLLAKPGETPTCKRCDK